MGSPAGWLHAKLWSRHSIGREGRLSHRPLLVLRDVWRTTLPAELETRAEYSVAMEATSRQIRSAEPEVFGQFSPPRREYKVCRMCQGSIRSGRALMVQMHESAARRSISRLGYYPGAVAGVGIFQSLLYVATT
ncbi:hypothetical protein ACQKWADRAFT_287348 [Trichoderma austrokoningii]